MIEIDGTALYQWDVGRRVVVTDIEVEYVHFANKGDAKAVVVGAVDIHAKIPDHLLQTGKQLCVYAVKDGITVESKIFYVKTRERPNDYVYEEKERDFIYALIDRAEKAIDDANMAAEDASNATEGANTAMASAKLAAENANKSADSATLAAKNANDAADKANHTAKSLMVVGSAEGDSIHLDDAIDQFVVGLRVFGKTTQNGTPTHEAPVELESVENSTVTVNNQTLLVPYTLHGIPVSSGGNYTDANGQQWICDEIDFAMGMYIKRVALAAVNASGTTQLHTGGVGLIVQINPEKVYASDVGLLCTHAPFDKERTMIAGTCYENQRNVVICGSSSDTFDSLVEKYGAAKFMYVRREPIETSLTEEVLAAFAALRTNRGSTTVSNDASAHMEIEYVMDAKKYIDSLVTAPASSARIAYVNLPASKWTGSGNLYSQVVSIAGITENSQVNLAPSVEQLAVFYEKDLTFVTENDGGVVTVYVIGQKPQNDYTIQADIVEVIA